MALCTNACNENEMVSHDFNLCQPTFKGDAYSVAYIFCDAANNALKANYTASGVWNTLIAGLNSVRDVVVVNGVVVGLTPEIVTQENPYKNGFDTSKMGEKFELNVTDPNVSCDNWDFYRSIDRRIAYVVIAFKDGRMWVSEEKMQLFSMSPGIENGAFQMFSLTASRTFENGKGFLCFASQPVGIFTY